MAHYGRFVTNGDYDMGDVGYQAQRATVYDKTTENGWGDRLGFWGGKFLDGGTPTVQLAVWSTTSSMTPDQLLANGGAFTVNTPQSYGRDGQAYTSAIVHTDSAFSPAATALKLTAGTRYAIGVVDTAGDACHFAMIQASRFSADNEQFYVRTGVTAPHDPFAYTSASTEGWMSCWIEYQPNRAPTAATTLAGQVETTTPTLSGTFSDPDTGYGDHLKLLRIQVVRASDTALMWDSGTLTATASEQDAAAFSRAYRGAALSPGVGYQWRCQVADDFGTWSAWTAYATITVNGGGTVTPTSPTGTLYTQQPTPFTATWTHASGLAMTHVEARLTQGGSVIATSGAIAQAVSAGGTITVTWSAAFGSYALSWGLPYQWELRGQDSGGLWSDWASQAIATNTPPVVPHDLSPANSAVTSSLPTLTAQGWDADGDALTLTCRIYDGTGTLVATRPMTLPPGNAFTRVYQTTSSDLAAYGAYTWDAYASDGHLYSGGDPSTPVASGLASFVYAEGPIITITSPTEQEAITSSSPTVTWTVTDQQKYQVTLAESGTTVYDSGVITSTTSAHTIPSGYVRNGHTYQLQVAVTNSAPLTGTSDVRTFSVSYVLPATITNLLASPEYQRFDPAPSAIRLTWDASADPTFTAYLITRRITGGSDETILARLTSAATTVFVDALAPAATDLTYAITQATVQGLDITVSDAAEAQAQIGLDHVVLCDVRDGADNRAVLRLNAARGFTHVDDLVLEQPWGASAPVGVYGTAQYQTFSGTFTLATDDVASAREHTDAVRGLWRSRATVCYRDERGRRFFARITKFREDDQRVQFYTVQIELTEVDYTEGVG